MSCNVVSFFTDSYERRLRHVDDVDDEQTMTSIRRKGRPRNEHVKYNANHPKWKSVERIIRCQPHTNDFYCASMLMLLKPWRNLRDDLKASSESWATAFETFRETVSTETHGILSGIGYLHDCESAIANDDEKIGMAIHEGRMEDVDDEHDIGDADERIHDGSPETMTEESLYAIIRAQTSLGEEIHGRLAIEFGKRAKIFMNEIEDKWNVWGKTRAVGNATGDHLTSSMAKAIC